MLYWHLNPKDYENDEELRRIREARGYNYMVPHFNFYYHFFFFIYIYLVVLFNSRNIHSLKKKKIAGKIHQFKAPLFIAVYLNMSVIM